MPGAERGGRALADDLVGPAQDEHRDCEAGRGQRLLQRGTESARDRAVLQCHEETRAGCLFPQAGGIERLDEARVDDPRLQRRARQNGGDFGGERQHVAQRPDPDGGPRPVRFAQHLRASVLQGCGRGGRLGVGSGVARVADGDRTSVGEGRGQHARQHGVVARLQDRQVRQAAQHGNVVEAVVRGAVGADHAGAVEAEEHGELLQADVVENVIHAALQEGGVDRHDRTQAAGGLARGEGHRMALADADVEEAAGMLPGKGVESRAAAHGGGDGDDPRIRARESGQQRAQGLGKAAARGGTRSRGGVEGGDAVPRLGGFLGGGVAAALLRGDVQDDRPVVVLGNPQSIKQRRQVVAVDRADVAQTQLLEERVADEDALDGRLEAVVGVAQEGQVQPVRRLLDAVLDPVVGMAGEEAAEMAGEGADAAGDRHLVVVEDEDKAPGGRGHVVERLERDAVAERGVADHGDDVFGTLALVAGHREAEGG